ncbi:hypothetical protein HIM_05896 [Hirsutella minnesotensis 3608]|uniref:Uncharacterized protein n=1 Tax=Hirsutella minnesotensis 3608 TaxID=1043627 RepID=A0A0F8A563_9HYPO|nr:hypothetical protein HIM_05896 [Hirsutella minnesotensis 3608]
MEHKLTPIAVVGMSCRLPGDVTSLDDFWHLLSRARSAWSELPKDRVSSKAYWHPNPGKEGCFNNTGGYFLNRDLAEFDAPFFNISQQEAQAMDPQQRQLLECTFEALENAGIRKEDIAGQNTGVFVGGSPSDYQLGIFRDVESIPTSDATGNHQSLLAGRIAHYFDLRGPCFAVDTACSSSLHALHQAVQSLRAGESDQAVVASCRLNLAPEHFISMSTNRLLSEQGITHAFDHRANSGFARGEGVGCVILKPLSQAVEDNDKIWSVIVNTGINQDGRTVGITSPNVEAQEQLMREVYAKAGISTTETGFVEAHGTGTRVGDPIEAKALYEVFGRHRSPRQPIYVGSAKTNVGHLEPASGVVSLIKACLMLEKGFIAPNAGFERGHPSIPFSEWNLKVPTTIRPWPRDKKFLSINNFGFGGSNAHCVLQRWIAPIVKSLQDPSSDLQLFAVSANDEKAVAARLRQLGVYLEKHPGVYDKFLMSNLAHTLGVRRSQLSWRAAVVASTTTDLAEKLNQLKAVRAGRNPKVAFVYTGQGAQWHAMGRELMSSHHVYASSILRSAAFLKQLDASFSLVEELGRDKEHSRVNNAWISQPACTAVQIALTDLLQSWGIHANCVVGHSSGEIGAAYAAGAISHEDALLVAYHRGSAVLHLERHHTDKQGSMLAAGCGKDVVVPMIKKLRKGYCVVACENSPSSVTVSGDSSAIDELFQELQDRSIFSRKLLVDVAYHSSHMEAVASFYQGKISGIRATSPSATTYYSSLHGKQLGNTALLDQTYWVDNLTHPVCFSQALESLVSNSKPNILVEIGPHSALEGPIKQILRHLPSGDDVLYVPSLKRQESATFSLLNLAGKLFQMGVSLSLKDINNGTGDSRPQEVLLSNLAPYPWSGQRFWTESRASKQDRLKQFPRHDLLGTWTSFSSDLEPSWRNVLRTADVPWLVDHRMQGLTAFPFSGYVSMAIEAASQRAFKMAQEFDQFSLREMQVTRPLILEEGEDYELILNLQQYSEGTRGYSDKWKEFKVHSYHSSRGWIEHCHGLVATTTSGGLSWVVPPDTPCDNVPSAAFYSELAALGAEYGPSLQGLQTIKASAEHNIGFARVAVPNTAASMPHGYETGTFINAAFLDLLFQHTFITLGAGRGAMPCLYMPLAVREMHFSRDLVSTAGTVFDVTVQSPAPSEPRRSTNVSIVACEADISQRPSVIIEGFELNPVNSDTLETTKERNLCYKMTWEPLKKKVPESSHNGHAKTNGHAATNGNGVAEHSSSVLLITKRPKADPLVNLLCDSLCDRTGRAPIVSSLEDADAVDKVVINMYDMDDSMLATCSSKSFENIRDVLVQCSGALWVTSGAYKTALHPHRNMAQGLCRTVRSETDKSVALLDLDPESTLGLSQVTALIMDAVEVLLDPHGETAPDLEFAEDEGKLVVPRMVEDSDLDTFVQRRQVDADPYLQNFVQTGRRLKLDIQQYGALDTLYFTDDEEKPLREDEIEIHVHATGMNFKDVVISMGQLASPYIGVECSGVVSKTGPGVTTLSVGDRVCAMPVGAYRSYARCKWSSAAKLPDDMPMETGASIPVVYCTAYYGLVEIARLLPGERVLIHAAAGGVGQAAIQIAQMIGAEIFATVGNEEKAALIRDKYGIPSDRIFSSRNTSFGDAIRRLTGGQGVDVVLNSLAGEFLRETWDCIGHFGRFVEIGKRDISSNTRLEMRRFDHNALFSSVDLTVVAAERPKLMHRLMTAVMEALSSGALKPIYPVTVMGISDVEKALRLLQGGKTTGKLVITHRGEDQVKATHPKIEDDILSQTASYVILGGTGGLGRAIAEWMVGAGAGKVVLISRSGRNAKVDAMIQKLGPLGSRIDVRACDISDAGSLAAIARELSKSTTPCRGVIHATMVLRDMLFEQMSFADFDSVVRSKVPGAWNAHNCFSGAQLDFFITLSSIAGIIGNKGQAAYAAANTFLDALIHYRTRLGLPAVAIDLPAMDEIGYLAENADRRQVVLGNLKGNTANMADLAALLRAAIGGANHKPTEAQIVTGIHIADSSRPPFPIRDSRFVSILGDSQEPWASRNGASVPLKHVISMASNAEEAERAVADALVDRLAGILLLAPGELESTSSVTAYGLDSLNAIELRNWVSKELLAHLQVLELLTSGSIRSLAALILRKSRLPLSFDNSCREPNGETPSHSGPALTNGHEPNQGATEGGSSSPK